MEQKKPFRKALKMANKILIVKIRYNESESVGHKNKILSLRINRTLHYDFRTVILFI